MDTPNTFIWGSEVQQHELDIQDIVNNAAYLQYLDRARIQILLSKGVDWKVWHQNGFNIVLTHIDMELKNSLKVHDKFYVKSTYEKSGRLKIIFYQSIYRTDNDKLIAKATNTVVCVSIHNGKPVMPNELLTLLFSNTIK
ncbi:MAG: acyl-CoA thioesterase [Gammaproteobacteria bacterium]|nr:acyl-CoA thioesterase [Gammaproteobacteria bacterium]